MDTTKRTAGPTEMTDGPCPLPGYRWATPEDKHEKAMYFLGGSKTKSIELAFEGEEDPYWTEPPAARPMVPIEVTDES